MGNFSAIALFCEDIRREERKTETLVGILPDRIAIPVFPAAFPKLGVYVRINLFNYDKPPSVLVRLMNGDETELHRYTVDPNTVEDAIRESREMDVDYAGIISRTLRVPFEMQKATLIRAMVTVDDTEQLAGAMRIIKAE